MFSLRIVQKDPFKQYRPELRILLAFAPQTFYKNKMVSVFITPNRFCPTFFLAEIEIILK